jgi:hypothetical protein
MVYGLLLVVHSLLRWLVVGAGVAAVAQAGASLATGGSFEKRHRLTNLVFVIAMDVQLLIGIALYAVFSPITTGAFSDFGAAMKNADVRYWAVEHITGMVIAVIAMHVSAALGRRASSDRGKHIWFAVGFGIALLAVLGSIPWVSRPLLRFAMGF